MVFVDPTGCLWLRTLRRGFRHCFAAISTVDGWILCDPLKNRLDLFHLPVGPDFDLALHYATQGHHVLEGALPHAAHGRASVPGLLTCVSVVKRLLRVRAPWIVTPWQLHQHLLQRHQPRFSALPARIDGRNLEWLIEG